MIWSAAVALLCRFGFSCLDFCFCCVSLGVRRLLVGQKEKNRRNQSGRAKLLPHSK